MRTSLITSAAASTVEESCSLSSASGEQECDASSPAESSTDRPLPQVIINGQVVEINEDNFVKHYGSYPPTPPKQHNGNQDEEHHEQRRTTLADESGDNGDAVYYVLNDEKPVLYIPNFLNETIIDVLIKLCIEGNRFVRSPVRKNANHEVDSENNNNNESTTKHDDHRTSESCTGIPVAMYRNNPKVQAMIYPHDDPDGRNLSDQLRTIKQEMEFHWYVSTKASKFIRGTSSPSIIEPLQLVRYTHPASQYKLHHDHGGFYYNRSGDSSTSSPELSSSAASAIIPDQRPWTMLVFLNTPTEGGHTSFPKLGLEVIPRSGDAIVWSNVKRNNNDDVGQVVDPDMVHAGMPPTVGEKYALNVWFGQDDGNTDDLESEIKLQQQGRWQQ